MTDAAGSSGEEDYTRSESERGIEDDDYVILGLYKFFVSPPRMDPSEVERHKEEIEAFLRKHHARGAILLSREGINGTVSYPNNSTKYRRQRQRQRQRQEEQQQGDEGGGDPVYEFLTERFPGLRTRVSYHSSDVFFRLRVRIKTEIVTMGVGGLEPTEQAGQYVKPEDWNELITDPDCLMIDVRNHYETQAGSFKNAIHPQTKSFPDFPAWLQSQLEEKKPSKVAMFCTGGIRCEKATSYCKDLLAKDECIPVYQLEGGILAYLDEVPPERSTFEGECYVFDQRIAVTHGLKPSKTYRACHACRHPLTPEDRNHPTDYRFGIFCPYCKDDDSRRRDRYEARQMHMQVAEKKGILHIHDAKEQVQVHVSRTGIPH